MSFQSQVWHGSARSLGAVLWLVAAFLFATVWASPDSALAQNRLAISSSADLGLEERKRRLRTLPRQAAEVIECDARVATSGWQANAASDAPVAILPVLAIAEVSTRPGPDRPLQGIALAIARAAMFRARAPPASMV